MERRIIAFAAAFLFWFQPALAERREAAVIGNSSYPAAPLANAARDAAAVAEALAEAGFSVHTYFDVPRGDMDRVLTEIGGRFADADLSVFYYAGHAFQFNGENQLLAVDVPELTRPEIETKRIALSEVLNRTEPEGEAATRLRLVIIDACRNDPFSSVDSDFQRGIAFEESGDTQTLIAYSTSAGELAYDGPAGGNGPYALALARALRNSDATVSSALRSIRRDVRLATEGLQIPWVVGSAETDPSFGAGLAASVADLPASEIIPALDEIVWSFVRNDLTAATLSQFVSNFPESPFVNDATQRMREIELNREDATRQLVLVEGVVSGDMLNELAEAREQVEAPVAYKPETNIPAELFAIWPETLPAVDGGLAGVVTRCDILAADPADPQSIAPPVREGLVNIREAARACGFALAADPENPRLLHQFGRVLEIAGRYDWARAYYTRASAYKYSAALTNLGYMAIQGIGQDKDFAAAGTYYRQAAELGNLRARTNIGTMFIEGVGRPVTPEEGVLWYRLASGMGWANAQNALADLYRKGIGVEKDERASAALYLLAAENGQRAAMNSLGRSYIEGWGVEPDRDTAHLWFERAIEAGDRFAPRFFARDLINGGEARSDPDRVLSLLQLSADRGFAEAYTDLAKVFLDGAIIPPDPARAYLNARFAELREVEGAAELVARAKAGLDAEAIAAAEAEIEQRRRLNGI